MGGLTRLDDLRFETLPWLRLRRAGPDHYAHGGTWALVRLSGALLIHRCSRVFTRVGFGRRYCTCCGWRGSRFLPHVDGGYVCFDTACPKCHSYGRHRSHRLLYDRVMHMSDQSGSRLYMAPESNLGYL